MRMLLGYKMMNVVVDDAIVLRVERALYERSINYRSSPVLLAGLLFFWTLLYMTPERRTSFSFGSQMGKIHFWYLFLRYILIICFIGTEKVPVFKTKKFL